ncbi:coiled-coil domain-containing protein 125 isoform X1 [Dasypus novemcinctus]|uniref:coiled-coil domain-containing protein 125 isoform X1 n=1 Tax=Dasypus novemcinctus TaxID=9361 RepID=UPI00265D8C3C|nr:coiled-coil domain-containing protein 125 isoform X1 [Dasypus novemcinctus]XP_004465656.2 coiled-coil domain-containing protein 125 isoform X1 [Dasypus novemcinctus]XP_058165661.1 coiled-coil domain-containing protein 125 isoform X1 [Dasypus novemcinctus]XP_058165677.1 coiled-coil domain-containing protein 125 isoform X1 [Dasypus novemcinctus]XP_058165683.1 coiled-coil domain-containing protein 125 isoform X1 [Dasypus novemcinctus]
MSKVVRSLSESEVQLWGTEDGDMTEGDLGYGLGRRPGGIYEVEVSHLFTSRKRSDGKNFSPPPFSRQGEESSGGVFQYSKHKSLQDFYSQGSRVSSYQRQSSTDSDSGLSTIELRQRLHETLEEVEFLKTELEASQRQLEGKEEALKILQSMAIFGKATSHTQAVFKKTVEQKRSLEKEINALQWEIEFDQNRFKNIEESWTQKYDRLNCENAVLKETLKLKTEEIKMLKSENAILNQQYLEALAMLDIKQQKMAQENMCHSKSSCFTEISGLELAVLGACLCHGPGGTPCSCAKMAASTRKRLLQLKQELELLQKSKEEAYIMADAFRIAFEQQLMRKNDQALRLTQMDKMCKKATKWINWKHLKEDGTPSHGNKKSLGQKLLDMLPSENSSKKTEDQDNPQEVFKMLIDLLNDKEAALAHQRKVSYMLARALEDKDTASKQNKEKIPMGENFPLKNPCHKTSEFPVLRDPLYSNVQIFNSVGCFCSIHCPATDQNYIRTLKKSCSLPSGIMF